MKNLIIESNNEQETKSLGKKLAKYMKKGDIIVLSGELGSGKTKFVEGFLSFYNLQDEISSPTFTIVNEYINENTSIFHFDVYRLSDSSEFYAIGGEEYFEKGICLIEWGELISDILPKNRIDIKFKRDTINSDKRILDIIFQGDKYETLINNLI